MGLIVLGIVKLRAHRPAHASTNRVEASQPAAPVSRPIERRPIAPSSPQPLQNLPPAPSEAREPASESDEDEMIIVSSEPTQKSTRSAIDNEILETAVTAIVPELNRCYREALERDKSLRGDITIEMTVTPQEGSEHAVIEDAAVDAEEFQAPLLEQCLLSAMITLQLPKPSSRLYLSYPFTLDPGDDD